VQTWREAQRRWWQVPLEQVGGGYGWIVGGQAEKEAKQGYARNARSGLFGACRSEWRMTETVARSMVFIL